MESKFSDSDLELIKEYGRLLFSIEETCVALGIDYDTHLTYFTNKISKVYYAYQGGRLTTIAEQRKILLKTANQGSSPAQAMVEKLIQNLNAKDI